MFTVEEEATSWDEIVLSSPETDVVVEDSEYTNPRLVNEF
jgi:hypothetical protein